ncbi:Rrf2 family transcriptional regulator [Rhodobacteraceae bacterium F11138]|nr:Rrf2 family transcriptional regulator [Rhodobacteraceae bacterium F11138]
MRLIRRTDLGLWAPMRVTAGSGRAFCTADLAAGSDILRHHQFKAGIAFAASEIVATRRDPGEAALLAQPARNATIGRIVITPEEDKASVACFDENGGACQIKFRGVQKEPPSSVLAQFRAEPGRFALPGRACLPPEKV